VAHVISAHHSRLAQAGPGQALRFKLMETEEAEQKLQQQQQHIKQLQYACLFKLQSYA
jgi:antagonist of KipI